MSWVMTLNKKLRRYIPVLCAFGGWILGISFFYLADLIGFDMPAYTPHTLTFLGVCNAIDTQLNFFVLICIFGFSMLSCVVPSALVFARSAIASFSCAAVSKILAAGASNVTVYVAFALASVLICLFLTSSARLADVFYTKVPHDKSENVFDYLARQMFLIGFATITMLIYFTVCKLV